MSVIPCEPICETKDPGLVSISVLEALGPGSPLRVGRDDKVSDVGSQRDSASESIDMNCPLKFRVSPRIFAYFIVMPMEVGTYDKPTASSKFGRGQ
jgi:hypothetical protein